MSNEPAKSDDEIGHAPPPTAEYVAELVDDNARTNQAEVVAAVVEPVAYNPSILTPPKPAAYLPPPSPMANLAAKGGAVGAIVLGVLSFVGSFITSYAILNSFLGLALGLWGLKSNHRRMAMIGILLCLISAFFCVLDISEWLQSLWPDPDLE